MDSACQFCSAAIMKWIAVLIGVLALSFAAFFFLVPPPQQLDLIDRFAPGAGGDAVAAAVPFGAHDQKLDVWRDGAAKAGGAPVVIFYYGGGWVDGDRQSYGWAARGYAAKGFVVVVPDYRKVPGIAFPAFVQDAADAVKWTHDNIARYGGDPERIAVAGHSAGAYAVAMLALDRQWLAAAGAPGAVKAAVGLSGPYDFYPFTGRAVGAFGKWPRAPETQPISYARKDAPPMLLITGTDDTTVKPKNARNLAAKLKSLGAAVEEREYAGQEHADIAMALSRPFRAKSPVLDDSARFLMAHLAKPPLAR
jgi:acetyl esterase/lipase